MSKHKHKNRYNSRINMNENGRNNYSPINNNPFGITPQQLLSLLGGGFNMNGLGNILSTMNMDGFDLNSTSNTMGFNNNSNANNNNVNNNNNNSKEFNQNSMNNSFDENANKVKGDFKENQEEKSDVIDNEKIVDDTIDSEEQFDEDIELIISLKSIVDPKRVPFLEKVIDKYYKGEFK